MWVAATQPPVHYLLPSGVCVTRKQKLGMEPAVKLRHSSYEMVMFTMGLF